MHFSTIGASITLTIKWFSFASITKSQLYFQVQVLVKISSKIQEKNDVHCTKNIHVHWHPFLINTIQLHNNAQFQWSLNAVAYIDIRKNSVLTLFKFQVSIYLYSTYKTATRLTKVLHRVSEIVKKIIIISTTKQLNRVSPYRISK